MILGHPSGALHPSLLGQRSADALYEMRVALISDLHGNAIALDAAAGALKARLKGLGKKMSEFRKDIETKGAWSAGPSPSSPSKMP